MKYIMMCALLPGVEYVPDVADDEKFYSPDLHVWWCVCGLAAGCPLLVSGVLCLLLVVS